MSLVLIGAGGHCRSCIDVAESAGREIAGFLDPQIESSILSYPRLGDDQWLDSAAAMNVEYDFFVAIGQVKDSQLRQRIFNELQRRNLRIATLLSRSATISKHAKIADGCSVHHHAVINASADIGSNCIINTAAVIEHDVVVAAHCHVSTGAILNGGVQIGEGCMIGSRAVVLPGVIIAPNSIIGAGAVVNKSIDVAGTWLGVPARRVA